MKLKSAILSTVVLFSALASASYNGIIYIPTSVQYDIERSLLSNLDYVERRGKYVSYWNKSGLKDLCETTKNTVSTLDKEVQKLSAEFISESELFRHKGKSEINNAILNLGKVVSAGLTPIISACNSQTRMKEDQARELTSFTKISKIRSDYYAARNKLSSLISSYGEVVRAFGMANTSNFTGKFSGNQGWLNGYKKCEVDIKIDGKTAKMTFSDEDSTMSITRDLKYMATDKEVIKNFNFDSAIETHTFCSVKGTTFANLNYEDGSLQDFSITHRRLSSPAYGLGTIISCLNQEDELLEKVFAKKYKCLDLKKQ